MTIKNRKVFLDTSVIFAAVLSPSGGARKLFQLGEAGILKLLIGPNVLRECEEVVRHKAPTSLPLLAQLLELGRVEVCPAPAEKSIKVARSVVSYEPDAMVLAEAISAGPGWFVTHDKEHFLKERPQGHPQVVQDDPAGALSKDSKLAFQIGTPGDLLQALKADFTLP